MVRPLDHIQVVLDDHYGVARIHQLIQYLHQPVHIGHMQAGGRLVQNIDGLAGLPFCQFQRQLYPLGFAAGKGGGALPQLDIPQAHIQQGLEFAVNLGVVGKEGAGLLHRHVQHIGDGLALVVHFQGLPVVAGSLAHLTGHKDIRQEMHLDLDDAVALASLTPAALHIKAEPSRPVAPHLGFLGLGKNTPDIGKDAGIGGRVGTGGAADGRLVNADHLIHIFQPLDILMLARPPLGSVQVCRQPFIQDLIDQGGFTRTGHTGDHGHLAQGNFHIHMLQVVFAGIQNLQALPIAFPAVLGYLDFFAAGKIISGDTPLYLANVLHTAGGYHLAPVDAGPRADIHQKIRLAHGILIVFHHDQGVPHIPQMLEGSDQLVVIPLVQADAGLVQHIQHPGEGAADLGGQPDPLAFAAGKAGSAPAEGQIIQPHALEEVQPLPHFFQDAVADPVFLGGQFQAIEKFQFFPHAHSAEVADIDAAHRHGQTGGFEPLTVAVGAFHAIHHGGDLFLHPLTVGFPEAPFQIGDNSLKFIEIPPAAELVFPVHFDPFPIGAVQKGVNGLLAHLADGGIQCKAVSLAKPQIVHFGDRPLRIIPAASLDGSLPDGELFVGHDQVRVHLHKGTQASAGLTGAKGVVEAEHPGAQFLHRNTVFRAGITLAELGHLPVHPVHIYQAAGEGQGSLQAVGQSGTGLLPFHGQPIHHDLHRMFFVLFQGDVLVQVVEVPVDPHTHIAGPAGSFQFLLLGAFATPHHRGQHHEPGARRPLEHLIHHLVHRLLADHPPADRAMRDADAGIHQTQIVVDLGDGTHSGTGVVAGGLLVDADGRRQAGDLIHIRLFHLAQEHPGIAGKAFHIPALAIRIDGIEGQAGFTAAGKAGHHNQLVPGQGQVNILQIVLTGTVNDNFIVFQNA